MIEAPSGLTLSDVFFYIFVFTSPCVFSRYLSKQASEHSGFISVAQSWYQFVVISEAGGWVLGMDVQWAGMGWDGGMDSGCFVFLFLFSFDYLLCASHLFSVSLILFFILSRERWQATTLRATDCDERNEEEEGRGHLTTSKEEENDKVETNLMRHTQTHTHSTLSRNARK
ncbi:hypothetical protein K456DRAFT_144510 [Colletotrichum gloeosporioides 23]|nr:hypothetical protein K456DRAFT_144510 [Colletotrichum gloeosporioides 23]